MVEEVKKEQDWMQTTWRPAMGWMYMVVCVCDFVIFPVLWSILHAANITQWNPLTLQGAGLFHVAMGAVLGITAFGRTQEKLAGSAINITPALPTLAGPSLVIKPTLTAFSGLDPSDPQTRNTRND